MLSSLWLPEAGAAHLVSMHVVLCSAEHSVQAARQFLQHVIAAKRLALPVPGSLTFSVLVVQCEQVLTRFCMESEVLQSKVLHQTHRR